MEHISPAEDMRVDYISAGEQVPVVDTLPLLRDTVRLVQSRSNKSNSPLHLHQDSGIIYVMPL
jgi:hypothetical protein